MEKAREALTVAEEQAKVVDGIEVRPHIDGVEASFFEGFALRGIHVDHIQPGFLSCSFTVPPRLTDVEGKLASGAIANLVDEVGGAAISSEGCQVTKVSVDMNIAFVSSAELGDEVEIRSRVLGHKGGYSGTHVLVRNKKTGQVIAEGRHSLFGNLKSKL